MSPAELQALLDDTAARLGVVGAQLAVHDGDARVELATGMANRETGLVATPETLFQIGSTTKPFTAVLVMQLVEAGALELDTPLREVLPELRLAEAAEGRVTCRHLLSMTSGIDNGPYSDLGRGDDCVASYVESLAEIPLLFEPGHGFGYSNASTVVAGRVVEALRGQCWDDALREQLLQPAGLVRSASLPEELLFQRVAVGYLVPPGRDPVLFPRWGLGRAQSPAGATLCASAGDLVRFARIFLRGGVAPSGERVLGEAAVAEMQTPQVDVPTRLVADHWGLGPYGKRWGDDLVLGHSGTNTGGSSTLLWVPSRGVAIATTTNVALQGYPLAEAIFAEVFPSTFGIAKPSRPQPDPTLEIDAGRFVGSYEAHQLRYRVEASGEGLEVTRESSQHADLLGTDVHRTRLLPLDDHRFLYEKSPPTENYGWDLAFVGDRDGRATHLVTGLLAARRREDDSDR